VGLNTPANMLNYKEKRQIIILLVPVSAALLVVTEVFDHGAFRGFLVGLTSIAEVSCGNLKNQRQIFSTHRKPMSKPETMSSILLVDK